MACAGYISSIRKRVFESYYLLYHQVAVGLLQLSQSDDVKTVHAVDSFMPKTCLSSCRIMLLDYTLMMLSPDPQ